MKRRLNLFGPTSPESTAEPGEDAIPREPSSGLDPLIADLIVPGLLPAVGAGGDVSGAVADDASFAQAIIGQARRCAERTAELLVESGIEGDAVVQERLQRYLTNLDATPPGQCILDFLAFSVWHDGADQLSDVDATGKVRNLSVLLSSKFTKPISHLGSAVPREDAAGPFESSNRVRQVCQGLMCPLLQFQGNDFFSITSLNPVTASCAGKIVARLMEDETRRRPFYFVMTTGLGTWSRLCRDQFGWLEPVTPAAT